jgi:RNA methyltransferase, TrmH family
VRITSTRNPAVKYVRALERAAVRRERGEYLAEGVRLITEAMQSGQTASLALYDPDQLERSDAGSITLAGINDWAERAYEVDERVLQAATPTETPAGIVAVLSLPSTPPLSAHREGRLGLILDGLADPGNAGTLLRSADAFGAGYVVATPGTADLYSPKVVRSGMGAHFHIPLYPAVSWKALVEALPGVALVAAEVAEGVAESEFDWSSHAALVIGSEAAGLSTEARAEIAEYVHIPMKAGVESLNAAVAGSILLYRAWLRQSRTY